MKPTILCILVLLRLDGVTVAYARTDVPTPWDQLGIRATAQYQGDGLAISITPSGALLRCVFQRLEGEVTSHGLWLTSTLPKEVSSTAGEERGLTANSRDGFRVVAAAVGRDGATVTLPLIGTVEGNSQQAQ
ncbi:MAG TPA: hypothetical protein DCE44_01795, partial [Verrucomicrobiales bacterium]|nr:hypothetical protein [Verrucomicrobiales bacterium]